MRKKKGKEKEQKATVACPRKRIGRKRRRRRRKKKRKGGKKHNNKACCHNFLSCCHSPLLQHVAAFVREWTFSGDGH
jgi:hypothetical protein